MRNHSSVVVAASASGSGGFPLIYIAGALCCLLFVVGVVAVIVLSVRASRRKANSAQSVAYRPMQAPSAAGPVDVADQLRKLAELRDAGVLTEDEFQAQKAKLL